MRPMIFYGRTRMSDEKGGAIKSLILRAAALTFAAGTALCVQGAVFASDKSEQSRPNVLLVVFDDLNDWVKPLSDAPSATPNLSAFARESAVFTQASTASPVCNPSRVALLTGVHPTVSGIYNNAQVYPRVDHWIKDARNLPQHFRDNGYIAAGYGKIFHHRHVEAYENADIWTPGYYAPWNLEKEEALPEAAEMRIEIPGLKRHFGRLPDDWDRDDPSKMQQDTLNTLSAVNFLNGAHEKPFFLALGIYRPHTHWYAARRYWDKFPREKIALAEGVKEGDLDDVPPYGRLLAYADAGDKRSPEDYADLKAMPEFAERAPFMRNLRQDYLVDHDLYKDAQRAYLASVAYADDMFGRVMAALEASGYADNTIVVVVSDHGYHLGEKEHWHKSTMWERSMRVPFMIRDVRPDRKNVRIDTPVSLLDVFPTLVDMTGINAPMHDLNGVDLAPVLSGERRDRGRPVISTLYRGFHSVRNDQYRYIRYPDGTTELYDLKKDPWEWSNLSGSDRYAPIMKELNSWIPSTEEETVGHVGDKAP